MIRSPSPVTATSIHLSHSIHPSCRPRLIRGPSPVTATSILLSHSGLPTQLPSFRPRLILSPNSVTATTFSFPISSRESRNSYITSSRNRPPVLNDHPTDTRTFVELLDEQKQKGPPSYYYLEDFTPLSHY